MDKYINGNLVRLIEVHKIRQSNLWKHYIYSSRVLFWEIHYDYWYNPYYIGKHHTEAEMLKELDPHREFFADGKVYVKAHLVFELGDEHGISKYFETEEEMEEALHDFLTQFDNQFTYI